MSNANIREPFEPGEKNEVKDESNNNRIMCRIGLCCFWCPIPSLSITNQSSLCFGELAFSASGKPLCYRKMGDTYLDTTRGRG
jgi:hypothetical protein